MEQSEQSTRMAAVMGMDETLVAFRGRACASEVCRCKPEGVGVKQSFMMDIYNSHLGGVDQHDMVWPPLPWQQAEDELR